MDESTAVEFRGKTTWTLTLAPGLYRYSCDPHGNLGMMNQFYVGDQPAPHPVMVTVRGKGKISVTDAAGPITAKRQLQPGAYAFTIVDRSKTDNFHLRDNGNYVQFTRATGKRFVGTQHWLVNLRAGQAYVYLSDPRFQPAGYLVATPL